MEQTLILLIGSIFILIGLSTGAFFCFRIFQAVTSNHWPFVIGELESSELKEVVFRGRQLDGGADEASARVVNFRYRYTVADREYQGKRVTYSDGVNKTARALRKLQDRYQGQSLVRVYYNPKNPDQSLLVPGLSIFNITPLITSALFILAGVFMQTYDFS